MDKANTVKIVAAGIQITATATVSAAAAIPQTSALKNPIYVRVEASARAHVKFGTTNSTATTSDAAISPGDATIFNVSGLGFVSAVTDSGTASVGVVPLEDV